jgi:hypothetical protein
MKYLFAAWIIFLFILGVLIGAFEVDILLKGLHQ